jgi:hypothetical protein
MLFNKPKPMFPLSCAGERPRSSRNAPLHTELLPRGSNFSIFTVNTLITHTTKNLQSAPQSSGRVKIFYSEHKQVSGAVKRLEGTFAKI